jgi:putative SOS response-associated peptidase YedK
MCGRYSWKATHGKKFKKLVKDPEDPPTPSYNRAPGQHHPTLSSTSHSVQWETRYWGNPRSESSPSNFFPINARSETVHEKPIFMDSFSNHRCLIPADGWFEWEVIEGQKYPHYIFSEKDEPFAFAGICKTISEQKSLRKVFSILTRSAPSNLLHIHHRAPVAFTEELWEIWLDENQDENSLLQIIQSEQPAWKAHQVSSKVNTTRNNGPEVLAPETGKQSLLF